MLAKDLTTIEERGRELASMPGTAKEVQEWLNKVSEACSAISDDLTMVFKDTAEYIALLNLGTKEPSTPEEVKAVKINSAIQMANKLSQAATNVIMAMAFIQRLDVPFKSIYPRITQTDWFSSAIDLAIMANELCPEIAVTGTCSYFGSEDWKSSPSAFINDITAMFHRLIEFYISTFGTTTCNSVRATRDADKRAIDLACLWSSLEHEFFERGLITIADYKPTGAYVSRERIDFRVGSSEQHTSKLLLNSKKLYYVDGDAFVVEILARMLKRKGGILKSYDNAEAEFDLSFMKLQDAVAVLSTATSMDIRCSPIINYIPYRAYEAARKDGVTREVVSNGIHEALRELILKRPRIGEIKAIGEMAKMVALSDFMDTYISHIMLALTKYPPLKSRNNLDRYLYATYDASIQMCAKVHEKLLKSLGVFK